MTISSEKFTTTYPPPRQAQLKLKALFHIVKTDETINNFQKVLFIFVYYISSAMFVLRYVMHFCSVKYKTCPMNRYKKNKI